MTILGKKQMSEEDIKLNFITPAIQRGWKGHITMETRITDGRINIRGNIVVRSKPKFADYLLYLNDGKPIAVVEAKDNNHSVSHGLQQAMTYAQMMDLPFAYSSNGDAFYEHDFFTGQEQQIALEKFPTQDELVARYYAELNGGKGISALEKKIVTQPYYSSQSTYPPRYYQRNAVNRTVEAIARGQQRLLLVMATGTGKTYTAFQIVYRLLRSDLKKRVLYLADRNILVDQSILQDFAPLEKTIYKVDFSDKECLSKIASHEVNFALYHQMVGQNDEEHFRQIPAEYFDLIIVDECHRGSAKEDSNWRRVLEYFTSATQIGMTATPKESEKVSNIDYFGEPVYIYSLKQGIEDGFLAPFKVINITTNIGDGWRPYQGQTDIFGNVIEDRIYNNRDYDYTIILQDRIDEVAREITEYLKSTDRMQKTIVFCASEDHAERMRVALVNDNQDMLLHDIEVPNIYHMNSLKHNLLDYTDEDKFDVILMNPPYGGHEDKSIQGFFPDDLASAETADLFLSVIMYRLKKKGRAAVVVPDGFLFGLDNAKVNIKKKLISQFNLHTVVRLPGSVFSPYTSITTNLLFFDNTKPTTETWFYRVDIPSDRKHFSKTKPMELKHFDDCIAWWNDRKEIPDGENFKAQKFTAEYLLNEQGCNIDLCGYPHEEEEILDPLDTIREYQERRTTLNAEIDKVLAELEALLPGGVSE